MLDWLNIKAVLSITAVVFIGTAGIWFDYQEEMLEEERFEDMLEHFVNFVDSVSTASTFNAVNYSETKYFQNEFRSQPYEIIITRTFAVFRQGQVYFSKQFISPVIPLNRRVDLDPGTLLQEDELQHNGLLHINSYSDIYIVKVLVNINGTFKDRIVIGNYRI